MHIPLVVILVVLAAIIDVRSQRVPNYLTLPGCGIGLMYHLLADGKNGLMFSFVGLVLGICLLLFFYLLGGMGAGDVKLMGAIGALLGWEGVLKAFLFSALVGGLYSIAAMAKARVLKQFLVNTWEMLKGLFLIHGISYIPLNCPLRLHYGIAIALGTLFSLWLGDRVIQF